MNHFQAKILGGNAENLIRPYLNVSCARWRKRHLRWRITECSGWPTEGPSEYYHDCDKEKARNIISEFKIKHGISEK